MTGDVKRRAVTVFTPNSFHTMETSTQSSIVPRAVSFGIGAALALFGVYAGLVTALSGWKFFTVQFAANRYWIIALALGFGIQVGLFSYARAVHAARISKSVVATSGTASGVAMLACCAHYLANILPFIGAAGIAGVAGFFTAYQTELFAFSLAMNIGGIIYLGRKIIQQNKST